MPQWIHSRSEHLLAKNPSMSKSTAFALATQQSHRLGKSPKGYGTALGKRRAKAKYDAPKKEYVKTPNPGGLETPKLSPSKTAAMQERFVRKARELLKDAAAIRTPESQLAKTQNIGVPKGAPDGKGIGQIAKPKGYGRILPGLSNGSM